MTRLLNTNVIRMTFGFGQISVPLARKWMLISILRQRCSTQSDSSDQQTEDANVNDGFLSHVLPPDT